MKNKIAILILISIYCLLLQTCKKDTSPCGGRKTYRNLTDAEKAKVPYTGSDTLVFVSNTNDTAVCIGQGKKQGYDIELIGVNAGDCDPDQILSERYIYNFSSNKSNFQLSISLHEQQEVILLSFNQIEFSIYLVHIENTQAATYIDSVRVNNKWYRSVNYAAKYFNPQLDKVFYNKDFGILKIQNADSTEMWELISKK